MVPTLPWSTCRLHPLAYNLAMAASTVVSNEVPVSSYPPVKSLRSLLSCSVTDSSLPLISNHFAAPFAEQHGLCPNNKTPPHGINRSFRTNANWTLDVATGGKYDCSAGSEAVVPGASPIFSSLRESSVDDRRKFLFVLHVDVIPLLNFVMT
jgi:hypothetical protein